MEPLDALEASLAEVTGSPITPESLARHVRFRRAAAKFVAGLSKRDARGPAVARVTDLAKRLLAAPAIYDRAIDTEDAHWLETASDGKWPALLGAMLLAPAWQWPKAPLFGAVPDWLWADYAAWIFTPPRQCHQTGDADRYAAHVARHLDELNRWLKRNPGSPVVRAAAGAYVRVSSVIPMRCAEGDRRRAQALRGEFLARFHAGGLAAPVIAPTPRIGRRLRVGFVDTRFGPGADLRAVRPAFAQLDPRSFETLAFSLAQDEDEFARRSERSVPTVEVLPPGLTEQVAELRSRLLDVVVYGGDVASRLGDITRLASQRVAPLQVVNDRSGLTSGLPEIELYVMGDRPDAAEVSAEFTERLGLLRGPAHSFVLPAAGEPAGGENPRVALGLPAGVTLFSAVVTATGVPVETLEKWARVLARCPESRLLIARIADELEPDAAAGVASFCAAMDGQLATHGVDAERVSVFPVPTGAIDEVRTLLRIADIYLDSSDGSETTWLAEALVQGRPAVVTGSGRQARRAATAGMAAALDLSGLIAPDAESFVLLAAKLAADAPARQNAVTAIKAAVGAGPGFLDELAASDAFGALLETAFDELAALGLAAFRTQREPLRCFAPEEVAGSVAAGEAALAAGDHESASTEAALALRADPLNSAARILRGRALLAEGEAARAVTYLLAAVERRHDDAELWFTLATALRQNQQAAAAIQALEASLRLDRTRVDAWLLLLDMAGSANAADLVRDAREALQQIAPDDPRVLALG
ncbi:MAG: hypothetical protein HZA93_05140 [Verrucomicrobia bacterium]|nr:hypothetical protein [Verrucomicrobiota bacterium]